MTILEALKQLRDDLKLWCINNFNNKLNKNLGTENTGKVLAVDENGNIVASDSVQEIEVSDIEPTDENVDLWINTTSADSINIPEINDSTTSTVDTWSSHKISSCIDDIDNTTLQLNASINILENDVDRLESMLKNPNDPDYVLPWANYDATNQNLEIGVPNASYYIKSTSSNLEVYQGSTRVMHWEGEQLNVNEIAVNGLVLKGDSVNGWSFV